MSNVTQTVATGTSAGILVSAGISGSLRIETSLINATVAQALSGDFTWFVSDITAIAGLIIGVCGVFFGFMQFKKNRENK